MRCAALGVLCVVLAGVACAGAAPPDAGGGTASSTSSSGAPASTSGLQPASMGTSASGASGAACLARDGGAAGNDPAGVCQVLCRNRGDAGTLLVDIRQTSQGRFNIHLEHPGEPALVRDWPGISTWSGHFFNFNDDANDGGFDVINHGEFHLLTRGGTSDGGMDLDNLEVYSDGDRATQLLDYPSNTLNCAVLR